jgi:predicted TIM-barrel fold metal-dependent hydrolase
MTDATRSAFGGTKRPNEEWLRLAAPEPVLEPDLPIIDAHMHFWEHSSGYRYFVDEFAHDVTASGHDVRATVFIECHSMYRADGPEHLRPVGETEFAVGMAAICASGRYTRCLGAAGIAAFADLTLGDRTQATLEAHIEAANGRLVGIRQRGKWDADPVVNGGVGVGTSGLYRSAAFGRGLDAVTAAGLTFDASVFHPQLSDVAALARAHPDANIVLIHTGSPVGHGSYAGKAADIHAHWLAGMKDVAACPNVSVKLGGLLMCLGNFDFTREPAPPTSARLAALWRPYIAPCVDLFGPPRCMMSSNFPVDRSGFGYGTLWNMFKRITAGFSADEKRAMFSENARRIYKLGDHSGPVPAR